MDKQAIKDLLEGFDFAALIPDVEKIVGIAEPTVQFLLYAGPFVLMGFGIYCLLIAPKEATYLAGYRFSWGMGSEEAWRFMQRLAGVVHLVLGLGLAVFMAFESQKFEGLAVMDLMLQAVIYIALHATVALIGRWIINLLVFLRYDHKGCRRYTWRELWKG